MPNATVPAEIRFALHDNLFAYAWALDRADAAGVIATFTKNGSVTNVADRKFSGPEGLAEFCHAVFLVQPNFKGRQHHVQPLFIEPAGDGWKMTSYWMAVAWDAGRAPTIVSMGYYVDTYAEEDGAWRFADKHILRWDADSAPMVGEST